MTKWFLALFITASLSLLAQAPEDSARTYPLDPITVTATRVAVTRSTVTTSLSVLPSSAIAAESQKSILTIIGEQVPGVFVQERGILGFGINTPAGQVTIRGVGGSPNTQVLMLIDGRPQFMGLFGHPLTDSYLAASAERIEVIRGPASLMYGTNAMGGVINIITGGPRHEGVSADAQATVGSFNSSLLNGSAAYKDDRWSGIVSLTRQHTDGHRPQSDFTVRSGYARAAAIIASGLTATMDGSLTAFRTSDPGTLTAPKVGNWVDIMRGYAGVSVENQIGGWEGALRITQNFGDHAVYDGFRSSDDATIVSLYQSVRPAEGNTVTLGIDYERYGGSAKNDVFHADFGEHHEDEWGAYALVQQIVLSRLVLTGGLRWEHSGLFGDVLIPQAGAAYRLNDELTLRASAGKGFRSPTIRELYLFPAPTPTLKPEALWNYEIGLEQRLGGRASVDLTGFVADGSSLIRTAGVYPNLTLSNSGTFVHRGVELTGMYVPDGSIQLRMSYAYLNPGKETMSVPRHKLFLGGDYRIGRSMVHLGVTHINTIYGSDNSADRLPNYTLVGVRVTAAVMERFSVFVGGENLLDESYQTILGYPMPGRSWLAGLRVNY